MDVTGLFIGIGVAIVISALAYGFYEWLDKVELEREYLRGMLDDRKRSNYVIRKDM